MSKNNVIAFPVQKETEVQMVSVFDIIGEEAAIEFVTVQEPMLKVSIFIKEFLDKEGLSKKALAKTTNVPEKEILAMLSGDEYRFDNLLRVLTHIGRDFELK